MAWHVGIEKFVWITDFWLQTLDWNGYFFFSNWNSFETWKVWKKQSTDPTFCILQLYTFLLNMEPWNADERAPHTSSHMNNKKVNFWWITGTHQSGEKKTRGLSFNFISLSVFASYVKNAFFVVIYLECHTEKKNDWSEAEVFCW